MVAAVATSDDETIRSDGYKPANDQFTLVEGFEYPEQPDLPYPTCKLKKGLEIDGLTDALQILSASDNALSDAAFYAGLAYVKPGDAQYLLNQWFGLDGFAVDDIATVDAFKRSNPNFSQSPASYKLITFPSVLPDFGIVSIRGTATVWDLMSDAQLWLAAGLFQLLREILPIGSLWTPILHQMVNFVSSLESESISRVAFYRETTAFVNYLKKETGYTTVQVTGHSLGGGLALITGSQTNSPAVGLSAPNAMLSRDTFDPPLTKDQLNTLTFNIVPVGDIVPMIDDLAHLYQNINCTAAANDIAGCHGSTRSACEIQYTCGSGDRPVICNCVADYGYPEPIPTGGGNQTNFTQACQDAAAAADVISGSVSG